MKIPVDSFLLIAGANTLPRKNKMTGWQTAAVTLKQKELLNDIGIMHSKIKYKGQACFVINAYMTRKEAGLATPKQLACLLENGEAVKDLSGLTKRQAYSKIQAIIDAAEKRAAP